MLNEVKNRMPVVRLGRPGKSLGGGDAHCDYCAADAVWVHWPDRIVNRNCYACDAHVGLLNPFYGASL